MEWCRRRCYSSLTPDFWGNAVLGHYPPLQVLSELCVEYRIPGDSLVPSAFR